MSDNNLIAQQSKKTFIREGYPLSSIQVNEIFDSLLYDLLTILTEDLPNLDSVTKQLITSFTEIEAASFRLRKKQVESVIADHTSNWRHI